MLGGTIASLGTSYVSTLSAQNCVSGEMLAEEQVQASGKEDVITALGQAASRFRETLGESLAMVQRYDQNIEMATTPSLEALKAYSQGMSDQADAGRLRLGAVLPARDRARSELRARARPTGHGAVEPRRTSRSQEGRDARLRAARQGERARAPLHRGALSHDRVARGVQGDGSRIACFSPPIRTTTPRIRTSDRSIASRASIKEAIEHLEEAVRLAPGQPIGRVNLGSAVSWRRVALPRRARSSRRC